MIADKPMISDKHMITTKYVSRTRKSDFSTGRLLEKEFCSIGWVESSYEQRQEKNGRGWFCRIRNAYPVAGMIKCAACKKWAPADRSTAMYANRSATTHANGPTPQKPSKVKRYFLCTDCRMAADIKAFTKRLRQWHEDDREYLLKLYWKRPVITSHWLMEGMPPPTPAIDCDLSIPFVADSDDSDITDLPINDADLHAGGLESDQTWGNAPSYHAALHKLRESFLKGYSTKKDKTLPPWLRPRRRRIKRYGAGCRKKMLPETEEHLQKEIDYYLSTNEIHPTARRLQNPANKHEIPLPMPSQEDKLWL